MFIEDFGLWRNGVDENAANAEYVRRLPHAQNGILQKRCAQAFALPCSINREASKDGHRNGIGHIATQAARRFTKGKPA